MSTTPGLGEIRPTWLKFYEVKNAQRFVDTLV